ncbi:uncharacterized protein METZ01_LOCUS210730 [marine metagenome]|uniref:Uncharacterized protein n=1 Tax=marine metagenome TaxID=408172 RepID=A0A382F4C6_9ZZZZ
MIRYIYVTIFSKIDFFMQKKEFRASVV